MQIKNSFFHFILFHISFLSIVPIVCHSQNQNYIKNAKENFRIYGLQSNPTGNPIGGGEGYNSREVKYNKFISNKSELLKALHDAQKGDIIYVADTSTIDLSGLKDIKISGGVTLASGRGKNGSNGAILTSKEINTFPLISIEGERVHITGLRFFGPDTARRTEQMKELLKKGTYYSLPNSQGVSSSFSNIEIDNCEFQGWSHAAIFLFSRNETVNTNNYIHHNYFHHNQRSGLGYGVCLDNSEALIEGNIFDWCRHAIAGTGKPKTSYEARYNLILDHFTDSPFDMHGGADRKDGTNVAGNSIIIHHNTIKLKSQSAVIIRGTPHKEAIIYNNLLYNKDTLNAIKQINSKGNFKDYNNKFILPAGNE